MTALATICLSLLPRAFATEAELAPEGALDRPVSAAFYADASCLLTIDRRPSVGRTRIDADVGAGGSRMLIHCDTDDGRRLTLLARGERLERRGRVPLLGRAGIEGGEDGVIAWLTSAGTTFADERAPRRYVARGDVSIRAVPGVQVAGSALHADRDAFARLDGELETQRAHPAGGDALSRD